MAISPPLFLRLLNLQPSYAKNLLEFLNYLTYIHIPTEIVCNLDKSPNLWHPCIIKKKLSNQSHCNIKKAFPSYINLSFSPSLQWNIVKNQTAAPSLAASDVSTSLANLKKRQIPLLTNGVGKLCILRRFYIFSKFSILLFPMHMITFQSHLKILFTPRNKKVGTHFKWIMRTALKILSRPIYTIRHTKFRGNRLTWKTSYQIKISCNNNKTQHRA